jgi:PAS domain S-box-containing protein
LAFLTVNDAAIDQYGYAHDEFLRMTLRDIHLPSEVPTLLEQIRRLPAADAAAVPSFSNGALWSHRRVDGRLLRVEASWSPIVFQGRPAILMLANDVTDRLHAERTLRSQAEQLEAITDAAAAFLESGDWRAASARILRTALLQTQSEYGFIGPVVEGPTLRILAYEGLDWDRAVNHSFYEQALRTYNEVGYLEFSNLDNLFGHVITTGRPIVANDPASDPRSNGLPPGHPPLRHFLGVPILRAGEVVGLIGVANRPGGYTGSEQAMLEILTRSAGVFYDSYRRQQRETALEAQLRHSQKMEAIGQLAGGIAHDFNNLLTIITGYCKLMQKQVPPATSLRRIADEIAHAGSRAVSLTQQLLAFSRKQKQAPRVLSVNELVAGMREMLQRLLGEPIDLTTLLDPKVGPVRADQGQIEQVLLNLAVNARDAMPNGGKLTIETGNVTADEPCPDRPVLPPGEYVRLAVTDTGCGMDGATRARIFEPFFTTKEPGKGTGLGLATAYGIVRQNGGHIFVSSEPGQGSAFRIYFPRVAVRSSEDRPAPQQAEVLHGTETVLVVEDEPGVRAIVRDTLAMQGYCVLEARNGKEALQVGRQHSGTIDLLITDVVMPHMNGHIVAQRLQQLRPNMRIVYMSGYPADAVAHHCEVKPGAAFLPKPLHPEFLTRKVREVLDTAANRP